MKTSLPASCLYFCLLSLLFYSCQSAKPAQFSPAHAVVYARPNNTPDSLAQETKEARPPADKPIKTVAFPAKKLRQIAALALPQPNATSASVAKTISLKKLRKHTAVRHIQDIQEEEIEGPLYVISGILLGIGLLLLLAALTVSIIGTGGAGTLALIGGSTFVVGSGLAIIALLTAP